jgi:hypothetical protein
MSDGTYIGLDRATFTFWRNAKIDTSKVDDYLRGTWFDPSVQQRQFIEAQQFLRAQKEQIEQDIQDVDFGE